MLPHLTYLEAVVTGLVQGVTELFPVSSLGHNVLLPALIGGNWASALNVSAAGSPYLAFIVGLHVATAIAMIAFFWRDWLRIVRGFFSSIAQRRVATPDQRLAWMIILGTIPVGIVGLVLQKDVTNVFARPKLTATFLAINGIILLVSERMRRQRAGAGGAAPAGAVVGGAGGAGGAGGGFGTGGPGGAAPGGAGGGFGAARPTGGPPQGYSQQPWQQQWQGPQGPDPRYGQDDDRWYQRGEGEQFPGGGQYGEDEYRQGQYGRQDPWAGQPQQPQPQQPQQPQQGRPGGAQYGQGQYGQGQYGQHPGAGQGRDPWPDQARRQGQEPWGGRDAWEARAQGDPPSRRDPRDLWEQQQAAGRRGQGVQAGQGVPGVGRAGDGRLAGDGRPTENGAESDPAIAADRRLSTIGYKRAVIVGAAQILALLPGISRDGIVTVAGMSRGLRREDAVRFSFLLSAPVILAAGVLKAHDLTGPMSKGIHGPILVGSLLAGIGAYVSIRFLTKYFSDEKSLNPFGIYCLIAGVGALAYLVLK